MTRATLRGGGLPIGKLQPYPKLGKRGGLSGFCCALSYVSTIPDSLGVWMSGMDPLQVGRCGSLPELGRSCLYGYVVRRGMVARYLLTIVYASVHTLFQCCQLCSSPEVFFMECLVVPAVKLWVRGVER